MPFPPRERAPLARPCRSALGAGRGGPRGGTQAARAPIRGRRQAGTGGTHWAAIGCVGLGFSRLLAAWASAGGYWCAGQGRCPPPRPGELPPPSTPRRRTCGCAALRRRHPPRNSRRLAGLSTLPATTSQLFPPGGSLSASLSLTHEPRLPSKGASGRSSVTANAAPGATGNLLPRRIQCPATRKDGGWYRERGTFCLPGPAGTKQVFPTNCRRAPPCAQ